MSTVSVNDRAEARARVRAALATTIVVVLALVSGCGGDDADTADPPADATTTTAETTTVPTYPPITTGSFANAGRLACIGGIETFEVTSAPVGSTLPTFATADAAVAAELVDDDEAETAAVVGPEDRGTRYVLYDLEGTAIQEVVVGETPEGTRVLLHDTCG
jgi:hypothetical protein